MKEKSPNELIETIFADALAPSVLDELRKSPEHAAPGGVKRDMTYLFTDIREGTDIMTTLGVDFFEFFNDYLDVMAAIIRDNRGMILSIEGDAILAVFGAPVPHEDHAGQACKTAVEMIESLPAISSRWDNRGVHPIKVGIGINTGEAYIGYCSYGAKTEYVVMGHNVNIAARMEGLTKKYGVSICITDLMRQKLKDRLSINRLGSVPIKNSADPLEVFELVSIG